MIRHHPGDEYLLSLAAGRLAPKEALVVAVHLERCAECRSRLHSLQAVGGALPEESEPFALSTAAWTRTLERIDARPARIVRAHTQPGRPPLTVPGNAPWPASLRGCRVTPWRWMSPARRLGRVTLPCDPGAAALLLLRIGEGLSLPRLSRRGALSAQRAPPSTSGRGAGRCGLRAGRTALAPTRRGPRSCAG